MPLNFGFDEFVATPECAASATTNCGCFFHPTPHNDTPCETGHYGGGVGGNGYLECMQYYKGNITRETGAMSIEPLTYVTPVNDEDFLVTQFEGLLTKVRACLAPSDHCLLKRKNKGEKKHKKRSLSTTSRS